MVKVSVIIPVYKVEKTLERCVKSVREQTLTDIEIILVDDGSPDQCPKMCDDLATLDARIKVIHKRNAGLGYARNSGIEIATGEYVSFLDSDDYVSNAMYFDLYNAAKKYGADAIFGGINYVQNGNIIKSKFETETKIYAGKEEINQFVFNRIASNPNDEYDSKYGATCTNAILSLELINKYNIRFKSERDYVSEDSVFGIELFTKAEKIVMLPKHYYYYEYNPKSLTSSYREDRFEKNKVLYTFILDKLSSENCNEEFLINIGRYFLTVARVCIIQECLNGHKISGIKKINNDSLYREILEKYPWHKLPLKKRVFAFCSAYKFNFLQYFIVRFTYKR